MEENEEIMESTEIEEGTETMVAPEEAFAPGSAEELIPENMITDNVEPVENVEYLRGQINTLANLDIITRAVQFNLNIKLDDIENHINRLESSTSIKISDLSSALKFAIDELICPMCKRLNPQHISCTSCGDVDSLRKALDG